MGLVRQMKPVARLVQLSTESDRCKTIVGEVVDRGAGVEALQCSGWYKKTLHLTLATMRYTGRYRRRTREVVLAATSWLDVRSYIEARESCLHHHKRELMRKIAARSTAAASRKHLQTLVALPGQDRQDAIISTSSSIAVSRRTPKSCFAMRCTTPKI
jgi:hypothetical protein